MILNYANEGPFLSKVKIGDQVYLLKDADLRAVVEGFKASVNYDVDSAVTEGGAGLITGGAVHKYVTDYVTEITGGAMSFIGIFPAEEGKTAEQILAENVPAPADGYVAIVGTAEYVYANGSWHLYGDEGVYATISGVKASYVNKETTIAGIDLKDNITADELKTALTLKALAYKDSASGTINVVTGVEDATYTPAGSVTVNLGHTSTAMTSAGTFTPAGDVTGSVTAAGSVAITKSDDGVQISGTVSAPTVTVTPTTTQVKHIASLGTLPSYTAAEYTAPSVNEASSQFASEGVVATIDGADTEMLVFSNAAKASALTGTGFNAGSYKAAEFNAGALPTYGESQTVVTGIEKAEASAPNFTGDKFGASFTGSQVAISANFSGTEGNVSVSGNYDKAKVDTATFSGTEATISHGVKSEVKTVVVS